MKFNASDTIYRSISNCVTKVQFDHIRSKILRPGGQTSISSLLRLRPGQLYGLITAMPSSIFSNIWVFMLVSNVLLARASGSIASRIIGYDKLLPFWLYLILPRLLPMIREELTEESQEMRRLGYGKLSMSIYLLAGFRFTFTLMSNLREFY